ncbi:hypothetical protein EMIHUDRAFT_439824 [Emiliania huxleyi CCMP1516]|uniref:SHSP domain-containing protein n=2 Tax=Emiliania huxleyi TaxID=2903 RepID=A0A0D3KVS9_EMIH1|nr:hypothetical protein EMIHUDRAFT_439824 [Emiliania huxleyi CCMP1516]EOD39864.1 hypothetical protein EMIHUDRAFT_439824 [Emiliania huxleyi CCMP1516]|eukprot:XP_005792293.1 hypothetical protein EMIHUDRAFT_439824 [Emiliania huxleyi CCMP1516]
MPALMIMTTLPATSYLHGGFHPLVRAPHFAPAPLYSLSDLMLDRRPSFHRLLSRPPEHWFEGVASLAESLRHHAQAHWTDLGDAVELKLAVPASGEVEVIAPDPDVSELRIMATGGDERGVKWSKTVALDLPFDLKDVSDVKASRDGGVLTLLVAKSAAAPPEPEPEPPVPVRIEVKEAPKAAPEAAPEDGTAAEAARLARAKEEEQALEAKFGSLPKKEEEPAAKPEAKPEADADAKEAADKAKEIEAKEAADKAKEIEAKEAADKAKEIEAKEAADKAKEIEALEAKLAQLKGSASAA